MKVKEKFDFSQMYVLENVRARLSPLTLENMEVLEIVANAPEIWTYFLEKGLGKTQFTQYMLSAIEQRTLGRSYPFIVFDKSKNKAVGITRLYDLNEELQTIKMGHTWYGVPYQGSGINKHCKYLLFEFIFEELGMERIGFGVHGENERSIAALKSVGCSEEGVLRNFLKSTAGKGRADLLHFSILKEEWLSTVKETLAAKLD